MTDQNKPITFVEFLQKMTPFLSSDLKKEAHELIAIFQTLGVEKVSDISKPLFDQQKKLKSSANIMIKRIETFKGNATNNSEEPCEDSIETLINDFKKMTSPDIKKIAKKFDVNLSTQADVEAFACWLSTGVKPPTQEERIRNEIEPYLQRAIQIRDKNLDELTKESTDEILAIADEIRKKYNVAGLKVFIKGLGREAIGNTAVEIRKEIASILLQTANCRFKRSERNV